MRSIYNHILQSNSLILLVLLPFTIDFYKTLFQRKFWFIFYQNASKIMSCFLSLETKSNHVESSKFITTQYETHTHTHTHTNTPLYTINKEQTKKHWLKKLVNKERLRDFKLTGKKIKIRSNTIR